jgi:hypothetical protein
VANTEKRPKHPMEQIDQADAGALPACARASRLVGQRIENRRNGGRSHMPGGEDRMRAVILRLEDLPATPRNLRRIRERVRQLNRRLADSGAPFRLRVV